MGLHEAWVTGLADTIWYGDKVTLGAISGGGEKGWYDLYNAIDKGEYGTFFKNIPSNWMSGFGENINGAGNTLLDWIKTFFGELSLATILMIAGGATVGLIVLKKI